MLPLVLLEEVLEYNRGRKVDTVATVIISNFLFLHIDRNHDPMTREVDREEQILEREDVNMTGPLFDTGISFFLEDLEGVGAE